MVPSLSLHTSINYTLKDVAENTPLHYAITNKQDEIVQLLLNVGAEISLKNTQGFNCLHHAALYGNVRLVAC